VRAPEHAEPSRPQQDEVDELRAAIATLSRAIEGSPRTEGNVADRIATLEKRLEEQEQSVRYVLQLLIEWLDKEGRTGESRAA
jgi:septal ring factor EnvC (AmiA/AmiB activator)